MHTIYNNELLMPIEVIADIVGLVTPPAGEALALLRGPARGSARDCGPHNCAFTRGHLVRSRAGWTWPEWRKLLCDRPRVHLAQPRKPANDPERSRLSRHFGGVGPL